MLWILLIMKLRSLRGKWAAHAAPALRRICRWAPLRIVLYSIIIMAFRALLARGAALLSGRNIALAGISFFIAGAAVIALYATLCRIVERRPVTEVSRHTAPIGTAKGLLAGFMLISAVVSVMYAGGCYTVTDFTPSFDLFFIFLYCLLTAAAEECVFRGTIYRITERSLGSAAALAVSALLFGVAHIHNPNASLWASAAIAIEAGVLFGAVYACSRSLWLPIGMHWAWNFTEGRIWGLPVSGSAKSITLFHADTSGPAWFTGGMFGPEASVPTVVICTALSIYLIIRMHRNGRWMPFRRRLSSE